MIIVLANITPKENCKKELIEAATELIEYSKAEEGNVNYRFYGSVTDETFLFVEQWMDVDALNKHLQTVHFKKFDKLSKELTEDMELDIYEGETLNLYD